jgi:hypothetical protein
LSPRVAEIATEILLKADLSLLLLCFENFASGLRMSDGFYQFKELVLRHRGAQLLCRLVILFLKNRSWHSFIITCINLENTDYSNFGDMWWELCSVWTKFKELLNFNAECLVLLLPADPALHMSRDISYHDLRFFLLSSFL